MAGTNRLSVRNVLAFLGVVCLLAFIFIVWRVSVLLVEPKLQISLETTFVIEPLTIEGSVDFAAAMHQQMSDGVTPEHNAAVLIDRAFGPAAISPELRQQYFRLVGIEPLPEEGDYVVNSLAIIQRKLRAAEVPMHLNEAELEEMKRVHLERESAMQAEFGRAKRHPWTREDCPLVAEWLEANAKSIELIEQSTMQSHYYSPLVSFESLNEADSTIGNLRDAIQLLLSRGMLRLGEHNIDGGWSDFLACHRLAQLVSQRAPTINLFMTAVGLDGSALRGDMALMAIGITSDQAQKCLADQSLLHPFSSFVDVLNYRHRLVYLEELLHLPLVGADVNLLLRRTNSLFDESVQAMTESRFAVRKMKIAAIDKSLKETITQSQKPIRLAIELTTRPRQLMAETNANALFELFIPAVAQADAAQLRTQIRRDQVRIGFALTAYRAEKGKYPRLLDELVPNYLSELPLDKFSDEPFIYIPREKGFLLYSVGSNGRDDGGRVTNGGKEDDVTLEIPQSIAE